VTHRKPRGRPFEAGRSGNPKGRPKGRLDRRSAWRDDLARHLPEILLQLVEAAKAGDMNAIALVLSRTCPPMKATGLPAPFDLPADADLPTAARAVVQAAADGRMAPGTARELLAALADLGRIIEIADLEQRIRALEEQQ
jgi:hypothetical protein